MDNVTIARRLMAHARSLGSAGSDLFRRRAFRGAAETILRSAQPLKDVLTQSGRPGLAALPGIGKSLARTIEGLIQTGEMPPQSGTKKRARRLPCGLVELRPSA